ncbi:MAG: Sulfoacetaldehyde reductase [Pseudomonadota bacterium]|jgi:short-subunit dehydrogenase
MAGYYATKAYVLSLTEALWQECRGSGVHVSCLCPGPTVTGFAKAAAAENRRLFTAGLVPKADAARVARIGLEGLKRNRRVVVPGMFNTALATLSPLTPRAIGLRIAQYLQSQG